MLRCTSSAIFLLCATIIAAHTSKRGAILQENGTGHAGDSSMSQTVTALEFSCEFPLPQADPNLYLWTDPDTNQTVFREDVTYFGANVTVTYPLDFIDCRSYLLLPFEQIWSRPMRAILYFAALMYCFLGVAIICDTFMAAIERITSKKTTVVFDPDTNSEQVVEVVVWNETVANLTLMALGSSAPEILLSLIETILTLGKPPGELGPSTIIGSAAFNLFVIIGVCITSVSSEHPKRVSQIGVLFVTAAFSLFAYVWMVVVLLIVTPHEVELWEAFVTLAFFFILIVTAYLQDRQWPFIPRSMIIGLDSTTAIAPEPQLSVEQASSQPRLPSEPEEVAAPRTGLQLWKSAQQAMRAQADTKSVGGIARLALAHQKLQSNNHCHYRSGAIAYLTGVAQRDKKAAMINTGSSSSHLEVAPGLRGRSRRGSMMAPSRVFAELKDRQSSVSRSGTPELIKKQVESIPIMVTFGKEHYNVLNCSPVAIIGVELSRPCPEESISLGYYTAPLEKGDAQLIPHVSVSGVVEIPPRCTTAHIRLNVSGNSTEVRPSFRVVLVLPASDSSNGAQYPSLPLYPREADLVAREQALPDGGFYRPPITGQNVPSPASVTLLPGKYLETSIAFIRDDVPGEIGFEYTHYTPPIGTSIINVAVMRTKGSRGSGSCSYRTLKVGTAIPNGHYYETAGVLSFKEGETMKEIQIMLINRDRHEAVHFSVGLSNPKGVSLGCAVARIDLGATCEAPEPDKVSSASSCEALENEIRDMEENPDEMDTYEKQFYGIFEYEREQGVVSLTMHALSLPWRLLFSVVPPTSYYGGYPTFVTSLGVIAMLTFAIGEFAKLFGCVVGLKDAVTALSFVALGTSLPDTFASMSAAKEEDSADSCIGNVTGSNSVNVFLGLGLPWVVAAAYYTAKGERYCVPAGPLAFQVTLFSCLAAVALVMLYLRRRIPIFGGGELGGPNKYVSCLIVSHVPCFMMWIVTIIHSAAEFSAPYSLYFG